MDQAEQLRNLVKQSIQKESMKARVITVTSGKGGVGKSNTAINLAIQLKKRGKRVIIFDADFGLSNIEVMFGMVPKFTLSDLIYKGKSIEDIINIGPMDIGFISGGTGIVELSNINKDQIEILISALKELDELTDYIIIDTGAGITDSVVEFIMMSREVLVVVTPEPTSLTDAYSLIKVMHTNFKFEKSDINVKIIVNRVKKVAEGNIVFEKLQSVVRKFLKADIEFLGIVPEDGNVPVAVIKQVPVSIMAANSKASKAYAKIACDIDEIENNENFEGISSMIFELLRRKKSV